METRTNTLRGQSP